MSRLGLLGDTLLLGHFGGMEIAQNPDVPIYLGVMS